jgi:hypothetical protein
MERSLQMIDVGVDTPWITHLVSSFQGNREWLMIKLLTLDGARSHAFDDLPVEEDKHDQRRDGDQQDTGE